MSMHESDYEIASETLQFYEKKYAQKCMSFRK